jgi:hypothetical protein
LKNRDLTPKRPMRRLAFACIGMLLLTSCEVADSYRVSMAPGQMPIGYAASKQPCSSAAGSYSLSKTLLNFEIKGQPQGPFVLQEIQPASSPDGSQTFCLDYLASPLSTDEFSVGYAGKVDDTGATGLLGYVASFAVDDSANVLRAVIRSIFIGISGDPGYATNRAQSFGTSQLPTVSKHNIDPLDAESLALENNEMRHSGFCMILDGYSFDGSRTNPQTYCSNPVPVQKASPSPKLALAREQRWLETDADRSGVLYRPKLPYTLKIYTKDNPRGPGRWHLRKTTTVLLENLSPVVAVKVNRAMFAEKRMGLEFDNGVLKNVCLAKSSEIAGFIDIPLEIVYGLVELPSATIIAEINRKREQAELVAAETALINAQSEFITFLDNKDAPNGIQAADTGLVTGAAGCTAENGAACKFSDTSNVKNPLTRGISAESSFLTGNSICTELDAKLALSFAGTKP